MVVNDPNIPEEEVSYPRLPGKQPMMNLDPEERSGSSDSRGPPAPPAPRDDEDMHYNLERYVPIVELENRQLRK